MHVALDIDVHVCVGGGVGVGGRGLGKDWMGHLLSIPSIQIPLPISVAKSILHP